MKELIVVFICGLSLGVSARHYTNNQEACKLLSTAYNEQDELPTLWYSKASSALAKCGYTVPKDVTRGKDAEGNYSQEKQ